MFPGRPASINNDQIVNAILKQKNKVIVDNSIVSKTNIIWITISEDLGNKIKPSSLHSYVTNDRYSLRKILLGLNDNDISKVSTDDTLNSSSSFLEPVENSNFVFTLTFGKSEFEELLIETSRQYRDRKGNKRMRIVNILQPQIWTEIMSKKIYDEFRIPHVTILIPIISIKIKLLVVSLEREIFGSNGYLVNSTECVISPYPNEAFFLCEKLSFSIISIGHCECGSTLKCMILPRLEQEEIVKIECVATKANSEKFGNCHKRQCRGETRKEVVSILEKQSVEAYRAQVAAQNMQEGNSYEPPHLYKGDVLRTARYQSEQKKYRDRNPLLTLSKFKRCPECRNVVRDIGSDPVIVHFWSPHQIRVFNNMNKIENARLCIDATGELAKYVLHVNNEKSHHIFSYIGVLYCSAGQFSVMEMFSESQDTVTISTWLRRWIQSGAQFPKEVVCDSSRALLNACCWAFTGYDTIEKYAEACVKNKFLRTYFHHNRRCTLYQELG
ncbi:hypothetical protein JTB14_020742 [Gonioctena quinquepunctata]|nr:hypothetical protein JTB14_020742 [Gonioctena quinquepunctata]